MTMARCHLVDSSVTRWYHCISRCVRQAHLLKGGLLDRKAWLENRLEELTRIFAISVGGFSVMDNHLHVFVRLDPSVAAGWSDDDVVRRWDRLFPRRLKPGQSPGLADDRFQQRLKDPAWVARARERLQSISWFNKCLKEPLSRLVNKEENAKGAFFDGRFKSIAILDDEALLAVCAYIDLNPVAAGIAEVPETSEHTSIKLRVEHAMDQGKLAQLEAAKDGSVAGSLAAAGVEEAHWLCPIEDRRRWESSREGMLEGFSLGSYFLLVDHTARLFRDGKAAISAELAGIFERLGSNAEDWRIRMAKLRQVGLFGRFFAATRERLREAAKRLRVRHLTNLAGCSVR
jgi:hypothetical protein